MRGRCSVLGKPTSTILFLRFPRKNYSKSLDPVKVVSTLRLRIRTPVPTITRRLNLVPLLNLMPLRKKVVSRLQALNLPGVHQRMTDTVRSRQTHQVPIRTKKGESAASVKSHPPRLLGKSLETTEEASHIATMRNFALSGVYSGYRLAVL